MTQIAFASDAYAAALRERSCEILFTGPPQSAWDLKQTSLPKLTVEFRNEGGSAITGAVSSTKAFTISVLTAAQPKGDLFNGQRIRTFDLVVIPPGQKIIETSFGPRQWISCLISRPDLTAPELAVRPVGVLAEELTRCIVLKSPTLAKQIAADAFALERMVGRPENPYELTEKRQRVLTESLSTAVSAARERASVARDPLRGRQARSYDRAYGALRLFGAAGAVRYQVADFCRELDATERQLRRSFRAFFDVGPMRLAKIYRANRVHRMLVDNAGHNATVASILANCSITELGRFAGEYKSLFGESPSETRRRLSAFGGASPPGVHQTIAEAAAR